MTKNTSDNDSTESNIENSTESNIEISIKKKRRNPLRWNPDGSPNTTYIKAISREYFNAYFQKHFHTPHTCEICGTTRMCSDNVIRHQKSLKCMKARKLLEEKLNQEPEQKLV